MRLSISLELKIGPVFDSSRITPMVVKSMFCTIVGLVSLQIDI